MPANSSVLADTLALAVPFRVAELRRETASRRRVLAGRAALVAAHQGDNLMFGTGQTFGHGADQLAAHQSAMHARRTVPDGILRFPSCRVCAKGQPEYSAGEIFSALVTGLACAALLPGGVSFAGLHWCSARHEGCPNMPPAADGEPS